MVLLRYQGPHGGQSSSQSLKDLHNSYHIHEYTEEDMVRPEERKLLTSAMVNIRVLKRPLSNSWNAVIFQIPMEYLKKNVKR